MAWSRSLLWWGRLQPLTRCPSALMRWAIDADHSRVPECFYCGLSFFGYGANDDGVCLCLAEDPPGNEREDYELSSAMVIKEGDG